MISAYVVLNNNSNTSIAQTDHIASTKNSSSTAKRKQNYFENPYPQSATKLSRSNANADLPSHSHSSLDVRKQYYDSNKNKASVADMLGKNQAMMIKSRSDRSLSSLLGSYVD